MQLSEKDNGWNAAVAENKRTMARLRSEYRAEAGERQALGTYVVLKTGRCARHGNTWRVVRDGNSYRWECDSDGGHRSLPYVSPTPFFDLQDCFNSLQKRIVIANENNLPAVVGRVQPAKPGRPVPFKVSDKRLDGLIETAADRNLAALLKAVRRGRPVRVFHLD